MAFTSSLSCCRHLLGGPQRYDQRHPFGVRVVHDPVVMRVVELEDFARLREHRLAVKAEGLLVIRAQHDRELSSEETSVPAQVLVAANAATRRDAGDEDPAQLRACEN